MIKQKYDVLLHLLTRATNLNIPYSDYVKGDKFPEQNKELINTKVTIQYRDYYKYDIEILDIKANRPKDDTPNIPNTEGPESYEYNHIYKDEFRVVRADAEAPFVLIGINDDYSRIIINSSEPKENGGYKFEDLVSIYPIQRNEFTAIGVYSQYVGELDRLVGATMRVDACEPCASIIIELVGDNTVRFTLGDEHFSVLYDYYDIDGSRDYDGRKAARAEETQVDVDGYRADHTGISNFTNVDGGYANNWKELFDKNRILIDDEVFEFRRKILEGKKIYGT